MYIICDLDGTLSENKHRRHLVQNDEGIKKFDEFNDACDQDTCHEHLKMLLNILKEQGYTIVLLSGRDSRVRGKTVVWLGQNGVPYDLLVMRPERNSMPDTELKKFFVDALGMTPENTLCVFDDRNKVVEMWRENGFFCNQVALGDF